MALSTLAKEQENFLRYAILIVDHTKEALQDLIELNLKNKHLKFEEFLNKNKHEIYHLCYDFQCCQCLTPPTKRKRIIIPPQLELLFDKYNKLPSHKGTGRNDFCCSYAKVGITSQVLDLSLARCLLMNCCLDVFWFTCLTSQDQTLEQFLNSNKHIIYHLWKNNQNCCHCPSGFIFPCDRSIITEHEWKSMFSSQLSPCENYRKRISSGSSSICSVGATPGIATQDINPEIQRFILQKCSHISKAVDFLVEQRNLRFAHVPEAKISDRDFKVFLTDIETHLLGIARVCGKETHVKKSLRDLHLKPLSINMLSKYEKLLHKNMEAINKNVASEHQKTRKNVSYKIRKLEDRIESLETSSIEIKENVQGLRKLITDRTKRSQLIRETLAEIDNHRKDQTYTEIKAVTACVQMLDHSKVLILTGREGSGKSRNSLEILRQMKEKHPETDVIKLKKLTQFSDIIKEDVMTIVMFEDVFGRITKQFCENTDVQILDTLHSYISLGNVRVIFVMRNNVKHQCQGILSSHAIFYNSIAYLDLNSKEFGLCLKEKERLFINYCTKHGIDILYRKKSSYCEIYYISIDKIKVSIVNKSDVTSPFSADNKCIAFESRAVDEMIRSDPYQGFPQSCRLFTQIKNLTMLGAPFFKYPSKSLLQEIDKMRMEGIDNNVKGLKYVILVYILFNQNTSAISIKNDDHEMLSINENNIDVQAHEKLFNECYNKHFGLKLHDIIYLYDELTCGYLIRKEHKIYFQHLALQESVLISYCKINPKAIIPLLSIDHIIDIVRPQSYIEQEEEIVIKISKQYYPELAVKIISLMHCRRYDQSYLDRLMESQLMTDIDVDLIYQLIACINSYQGCQAYNNKGNDQLSSNVQSLTYHYFPLYLLSNIGKLHDETLTVIHIEDQMLVSVTIEDRNIKFWVYPYYSLSSAFKSNYSEIVKWLLKNTNHSLVNFNFTSVKDLKYVQLLLDNVKHDMINMTQLFICVCFKCNNKEKATVDWMVDNVDNSLINYTECIGVMINEECTDMILHILKKINHIWLQIEEVVKECCTCGRSEIMKLVLKNIDHKLLDEEALLNITIDLCEEIEIFNNDCGGIVELIELLHLHKPGLICCKINFLFDFANRNRWYDVLELLFKHDSKKSIKRDRIIDDIFKPDEDKYVMLWDYSHVYFDDAHCQKIIQLILKYYLNDINVNRILKEAVNVGFDKVVGELLLDKIDNISHYLDITLDKLQRQIGDFKGFHDGHGKILLLLLQRVNNKIIDLNSVMHDLCHIGHSPAILWLLENKPESYFDNRMVMENACYHCDLKLVEYLFRKYSAENFDFKTAMVMTCQNSQSKALDVCKFLWGNIDRGLFDMKASLNNASRCDNIIVVKWILTDVDKELYDTESALLCACQHGSEHTVKLLLDKSCIDMLDLQYAITLACKNENNSLKITNLLYDKADKTSLDINVVLLDACKYNRYHTVKWIIETFDQNISVTESNDGNKNVVRCLDTNLVDINNAITCLLDMDNPELNKRYLDQNKNILVLLILKKTDLNIINIFEVLVETCKKDWVEVFKWILERTDHACLNIGEIINIACRYGAFRIVKWSLENIDIQLLDADNIMVESCGFGWLECVVLIWKHCDIYKLQAAMTEACTYGRLHIAKWLLQNFHHQCFDLSLLLKETGRNGWTRIFFRLVTNFQFYISDLQLATKEALVNGHPNIVRLMLLVVGRDALDLSSLSSEEFVNIKNETVVNFILRNFNLQCLDLAKIMTNACKFGWKNTASFIINNDSNCLCDSALSLIDISSFITGKHVNCLCDFTLAFNTACINGEAEIVQLLIVNVNHKIFDVQKAMLSTCIKGWDEIAILLLDNFEHTRLDICNALIEACRHGGIYVVEAILRKIKHNLLDIKTALNGACENLMHEELVLWMLEHIDQKQVDLKSVKTQAIRHKWRKVQFAIPGVDTKDLNEAEQGFETNCILIS